MHSVKPHIGIIILQNFIAKRQLIYVRLNDIGKM